jgi:hypothetical protein
MPCGHDEYCHPCASTWLTHNHTCPLCRAAIDHTQRLPPVQTRIEAKVEHLKDGHGTYKAACLARGLLANDGEWTAALDEAIATGMPEQLRALFLHILCFCSPSEPLELFERFCVRLGDDFFNRLEAVQAGLGTDANVRACVLYTLRASLDDNSSIERDALANLPELSSSDRAFVEQHESGRRVPLEHVYNYDPEIEQAKYDNAYERCSRIPEQKELVDLVIDIVCSGQLILLNVDAPGGCGKTYTFNCIMSGLRARGKIVLAVGSSGIGAIQLHGGKTVHSALKIPFDSTGTRRGRFALPIDANSTLGKLIIQHLDVFVWDETPMAHLDIFESIDYTFRQLRGDDRPFGGISVLLGGDFRQCLPVVRGASRAEQVSASILRSSLFEKFGRFALKANVRVRNCIASDPERARRLNEWAQQLLDVGDGLCNLWEDEEDSLFPATMPDLVRVRSIGSAADVDAMIYETLGDLAEVSSLPFEEQLTHPSLQAAILCPLHVSVDYVNSRCLDQWGGEVVEKRGVDQYLDMTNDGTMMAPMEQLNNSNPSGSPPFVLRLKVGMPLVVLRNMADGLMNGTRLLLLAINQHTLYCKVLTGQKMDTEVYIPRFIFKHEGPDQPLPWARRQFPVKPCWAMTINKSQGNTFDRVAVCLVQCAADGQDFDVQPADTFSHGQLYVALSRCGDCDGVCIYTTPERVEQGTLNNVVYLEALLPSAYTPAAPLSIRNRDEPTDIIEDDVMFEPRAHLHAGQELDVPWHGYVFDDASVVWNGSMSIDDMLINCADAESGARFEELMNSVMSDDECSFAFQI